MIPKRFHYRPGDDGDRRLAPFLLKLDPLADALVRRFEEMPPGAGWTALAQSLQDGGIPKDAPVELRAFLEESEYVPAWVDWEVIDRAGLLLTRTGIFSGFVLGYKSLVLGYSAAGGNKPLVFSGRLREQAPRRLAETARFTEAVCKKGGLRRFAPGFAIAVKVRLMHAQVRALISRSGRWQTELWGEPINQHDMAATLLLFSYLMIVGLRELGFIISPDEAEEYTHLFRYVGHLLGVDPELSPPSFRDAKRLADRINETQGRADADGAMLTRALLEVGVQVAETEREKRLAERQRPLVRALCRHLVGAERGDDLELYASRWDRVVPLVVGSVRAAEELRLRSPIAASLMRHQGEKYWETFVSRGTPLAADYDFSLPTRLRREGEAPPASDDKRGHTS